MPVWKYKYKHVDNKGTRSHSNWEKTTTKQLLKEATTIATQQNMYHMTHVLSWLQLVCI